MPHYFDESPIEEKIIEVEFRANKFQLISSSAIFSKDKLDTGTKTLLLSMKLPTSGKILDLGCGIGVVGIVVKKFFPELTVVQSDVTEKAVELTKRNTKKLKLKTKVIMSDVYENLAEEKFDVILVNPPRAAGKKVIERMINEAPNHLNEKGSLQLVAMTNKGGKSYEKMMKEAFGNCEKIGRGSGFSVYCSELN